ncbi:MAG TPA: hypothetical protein VJV79_39410, partial [Polyangiaceae bacterium]|nr:hypothetical protein [Polyangiaceae bacterium]
PEVEPALVRAPARPWSPPSPLGVAPPLDERAPPLEAPPASMRGLPASLLEHAKREQVTRHNRDARPIVVCIPDEASTPHEEFHEERSR